MPPRATPSHTVAHPLLWGLWELTLPIAALVAIVWVASPLTRVSLVWNAAAPPPAPEAVRADVPPLQIPVEGVSSSDLTDSFSDPRSGGRVHRAIDISAPAGTPVVAAAAGVVMRRGTEGRGGQALYQFGPDSTHMFYYAHLSRFAEGVGSGTRVEPGDVIGYVGSTGNAPRSAPHLHFAVWALDDHRPPWADRPLNPYPLLTRPPEPSVLPVR